MWSVALADKEFTICLGQEVVESPPLLRDELGPSGVRPKLLPDQVVDVRVGCSSQHYYTTVNQSLLCHLMPRGQSGFVATALFRIILHLPNTKTSLSAPSIHRITKENIFRVS